MCITSAILPADTVPNRMTFISICLQFKCYLSFFPSSAGLVFSSWLWSICGHELLPNCIMGYTRWRSRFCFVLFPSLSWRDVPEEQAVWNLSRELCEAAIMTTRVPKAPPPLLVTCSAPPPVQPLQAPPSPGSVAHRFLSLCGLAQMELLALTSQTWDIKHVVSKLFNRIFLTRRTWSSHSSRWLWTETEGRGWNLANKTPRTVAAVLLLEGSVIPTLQFSVFVLTSLLILSSAQRVGGGDTPPHTGCVERMVAMLLLVLVWGSSNHAFHQCVSISCYLNGTGWLTTVSTPYPYPFFVSYTH